MGRLSVVAGAAGSGGDGGSVVTSDFFRPIVGFSDRGANADETEYAEVKEKFWEVHGRHT